MKFSTSSASMDDRSPQSEPLTRSIRIRENHPDHSYYYTDGSKTVEGAGCSIVLDDIEPQVWSFKLPRDTEIFACEAFALLKAVEIACEKEKFLIFTDSKSVLAAICNHHSTNVLVKKIQNTLQEYEAGK
ncbi:hypothetical protein HHI36_001544 [Cryptolaemus montrouzieri]|uniref:RNase H type-1 domain-containing protein n=1 Tax=Cryptolaemus montrouzieri TaxID=559131 RepID=A0ABD2P7X4_9CUCU